MAIGDTHTLNVIYEVSRTSDRLAKRMGGQYVLKQEWRSAIKDSGCAVKKQLIREPA